MSYTADTWPTDRWPNFAFTEMACQETGECAMDKATMDRLQLLRSHLGFPLTITSGYRSPLHSIEAERALHFCVIDRRITQGTRGRKGQQWCERYWTIQATCRQQGRRICQFIKQAVYDSFEGNLPTGLITA